MMPKTVTIEHKTKTKVEIEVRDKNNHLVRGVRVSAAGVALREPYNSWSDTLRYEDMTKPKKIDVRKDNNDE